jgi:hypothetical protein
MILKLVLKNAGSKGCFLFPEMIFYFCDIIYKNRNLDGKTYPETQKTFGFY